MTDEVIAFRSELPLSTVQVLSTLTSWDEVDAGVMRMFTKACRMDFTNALQMRRATQYMRRGLIRELKYLKRSTEWETRWKHLANKWRIAITEKQKK